MIFKVILSLAAVATVSASTVKRQAGAIASCDFVLIPNTPVDSSSDLATEFNFGES
jgi:hypothetical protein